jgi:hypothetical protein
VVVAIVMAILVAITVPAVAVAIPAVVVFEAATVAIPISGKVASSLIVGNDPSGAAVWNARPISFMPLVMISDRVPVAVEPVKIGARAYRAYA